MAKNLIPWELILNHLRQTEDDESKRAFRQWMESNENANLFAEIKSLWEEIQQKVGAYQPDVDYYWRKIEAEMNRRYTKNAFIKYIRPIAVAATLLLLVATGTIAYWAGRSATMPQVLAQQFSTTTAKSKVVLPDGTSVLLNRESMITYNMDKGSRNVQLVGEGFFEVAKDEKRPFYVHTKELDVKVYGTKFNVRSYAFNKEAKVSLLEGHIALLKDGGEIHMKAGQLAVMDKQTRKIKLTDEDLSMDTLWNKGTLSFRNKTLREICTYMERWYDVDIVLDPSIANYTFTFTITDEPIEVILQNMSLINSIRYDVDGRDVSIGKIKKLSK